MGKVFKLMVTTFAIFIATNSFAMDIGVMGPAESKYSAELFYESFERDTKQDTSFSSGQFVGMQDEQRIIARLKISPQRNWALTLDAGATDAEGSEGYAPLFGLGGHLVLYENNGFYTSVFAKATYAFDIDYKQHNIYNFEGAVLSEIYNQTEEYFEYGAGFQLGKEWIPCSGARITCYTGAIASFIDSSAEATADYSFTFEGNTETGSVKDDGIEMEEEHPVLFFAGVEATLTKYEIGIRAENRFYDRTSFSFGLFKNF